METVKIPFQIISIKNKNDLFISRASLDGLEDLIPKNIDFEKNIDIFPVAFDAAVVNRFNKNGVGISSDSAVAILDGFHHKPTNIEHDKKRIVGHILTSKLSESDGSNSEISTKEALKRNDPYYMSLGAVLYRTVDENFAELLERSTDPNDSYFGAISASWEVGFSEYYIAVGSQDLDKCSKIITDKTEIAKLKPRLTTYGGSGRLDSGEPIFQLLIGDLYPLGIGYTTNPAAEVKGIFSPQQEDNLNSNSASINISENNNKNISQLKNSNVNYQKENIMQIDEILSELKSVLLAKKTSEETIASVTETFADAIRKGSEKYTADLESAQKEKQEASATVEALKESLANIEAKYLEASTRLGELEAAKKQEEAIATFNQRMEDLDNLFVLEDEDRKIIADDLKGISSEESFASYKNKTLVIWKHKTKESKASAEKEFQERVEAELAKKLSSTSTASVQKTDAEIAAAALAAATENNHTSISNNNEESSHAEPSLREKFKGAFNRNNIIISK